MITTMSFNRRNTYSIPAG